MTNTRFVDWPKYEEYKEMFKEHFIMEKRDDGVLMVRMHTKGGPQLWSMELHRAIGQMWRIVDLAQMYLEKERVLVHLVV